MICYGLVVITRNKILKLGLNPLAAHGLLSPPPHETEQTAFPSAEGLHYMFPLVERLSQ